VTKELANEIFQQQTEMEAIRADYEPVWQAVSDFCDPDGPSVDWSARLGSGRYGNQASRAEERSRLVYDSTIATAADRLATGLESLITPQSEKWHGLSTAAMNDEETDEEQEWAESLRDYLFADIRYSAASNFVPGIQACYLNIVRYGPAYLYSEEGFGRNVLLRYASLPVNEVFLSRNRWGEPDTFHRRYERSAKVAAQLLGYDNLPPKIQEMANDPAKCMQLVSLIQCVKRRQDRRTYDLAGERVYLDSPFASYHVICEEEQIVKERSFQTFPVACFNWRRLEGDAYGISPTIKALTTVKEVNEVRRTGLRALQQVTDPPTASGGKLDDVPVLNPGSNYPGLIDDEGRILIKPINTGQNPQYAFEYAANRAEEIRDMLYVNLFQTLVQNPDMTATEALIRKEEKGELLGPAGSVIQRGFAANLDRELAILEEKGLYADDSRFLPPASLAGKTVRPTYTSPLDVLRRAAEARDTIQLVGFAGEYAKASGDPSIMDNIDGDEALKVVQAAGRSPRRVLRRQEEIDALRQTRAESQKAQAGAAMAAQAAQVAKDAVPAAVAARDAGLMPAQ
jgi:hypothetical protein